MPENYKAVQVFGCEKYYNLWVNATNVDGEMKTLAAGQSYELTAHGSTDRASSFKPMSLPDGVYFTQISNQSQTAFGVDNQGKLWTWGYSIYGQ